jgi:hypothetical protein
LSATGNRFLKGVFMEDEDFNAALDQYASESGGGSAAAQPISFWNGFVSTAVNTGTNIFSSLNQKAAADAAQKQSANTLKAAQLNAKTAAASAKKYLPLIIGVGALVALVFVWKMFKRP